ncbi:hypothetical protein RN001_013280 [Aquatica leii]|uniref:Uncharacterized protein n=1 Tax=Aquatica leii TaxID=1421715 RepID=A0AAN7PZS0_9COLE|nr:hypothetical protein RN001_013280 [Aquatica leii]
MRWILGRTVQVQLGPGTHEHTRTVTLNMTSRDRDCGRKYMVGANKCLTMVVETDTMHSNLEYQDLKDIGAWPEYLTPSQREFILMQGPTTLKKSSYPKDSKNRSFSEIYYKRKLNNGEIIERTQLETIGFSDWQHCSVRLKQHEVSKTHFAAIDKWNERKKWRDILERIISIIQYLAEHNLALRGTCDTLFSSNNGNFLGLVELISKYDPVLSQHVNNARNTKRAYII